MKIAAIKEKIKRIGIFIPVRLHLLLLIAALVWSAKWLRENNTLPETARTAIIDLFITITFWFALAILIFSFLSAFIPWLFFLLNKKNKRSSLKIKVGEKDNGVEDKQQVQIEIDNAMKPLFGYIRLCLFYDGQNISPKFSLLPAKAKKSFFSTYIKGFYNWPLRHIKEYDINNSIIYFEDLFQFFSFVTQFPVSSNFFAHPPRFETNNFIARPKKTEDTNTRIEEMRKVEGEFLNYKNFENNDDVRRIVWKIYAKNKELVVRVPETNDPYASHIYFYASFYNAISNDVYEEFNNIFLNYFKTVTWNSYEQLNRQKELIKFIPDQQAKTYYSDDPLQKIKYFISTAHWQKQNDLLQYFNKQNASVLCISSFSNAAQVEEIIDKAGKELVIVFVQLTNSFEKIKINTWLQWLFIKPEKNSTDKLKLAFNLSPLKRKMLDNEKRIMSLLNKSECKIFAI